MKINPPKQCIRAGKPVAFLFLLLALASFPATASSAEKPISVFERGKYVYFTGTSPEGKPIVAYFGVDGLEVGGELATCSSCHGYDGLGRPESGVLPTNITWEYMTKSYGHKHRDGLDHPPFTEESLKTYMRDGIYPGGKRGDPSMPYYFIGDEDLDALIVYMKGLGTYLDPGVTAEAVRIGMVIPSEGALGEIGSVMERTVRAFFNDINAKGGIYGRKIEVVVGKTSGKRPLTKEFLDTFLDQNQLFALVSAFTPGAEKDLPSLVEIEKLPLIGPFTLFPAEDISLNRYTFYIFSGVREQARALAMFAHLQVKRPAPRTVILYPLRGDMKEVAEAAANQFNADGWDNVVQMDYPPNNFDAVETLGKLKKDKAEVVLFLDKESEVAAFLKEAKKINWSPYLFLSGVLAGKSVFDVPARFKDRVFLAYPSVPGDRTEQGMTELAGLEKEASVSASYLAARLSACASAKIFIEGIRRSGKDLSREKFISTLEEIHDFDTGLTPRISFNRNKRVGAMGSYIMTVDPEKAGAREFTSTQIWIPTH
jgi:ABC-type branched-subunit amino acid transport system substrate-binding protein